MNSQEKKSGQAASVNLRYATDLNRQEIFHTPSQENQKRQPNKLRTQESVQTCQNIGVGNHVLKPGPSIPSLGHLVIQRNTEQTGTLTQKGGMEDNPLITMRIMTNTYLLTMAIQILPPETIEDLGNITLTAIIWIFTDKANKTIRDKIHMLGHKRHMMTSTSVADPYIKDNVPDLHIEDNVPDLHIEDNIPDLHIENNVPDLHIEDNVPDLHHITIYATVRSNIGPDPHPASIIARNENQDIIDQGRSLDIVENTALDPTPGKLTAWHKLI